ncbi:hypothetical protein [Streptomyces hiroshimensis]
MAEAAACELAEETGLTARPDNIVVLGILVDEVQGIPRYELAQQAATIARFFIAGFDGLTLQRLYAPDEFRGHRPPGSGFPDHCSGRRATGSGGDTYGLTGRQDFTARPCRSWPEPPPVGH